MSISDKKLKILLADDDKDDRFLFRIALDEVGIPYQLTTVNNGRALMELLHANHGDLPDVLFLDLNMPLKNGNECVIEIKNAEKIRNLPIVIYSTSLREEVADILYTNGAHCYIQKTDIEALVPHLRNVLGSFHSNSFFRPLRSGFIINADSYQQRRSK